MNERVLESFIVVFNKFYTTLKLVQCYQFYDYAKFVVIHFADIILALANS